MPTLNHSLIWLKELINKYTPKTELPIFLVMTVAIFATRFPYLTPGYGNSPDAWRVARIAQIISQSGDYFPSRAPGFPAHELISATMWQGGPFALNGASALMSAFAAAFLTLIVRRLGVRWSALAGITLAFVPLVFVASVEAIDPVWGIAFMLAATFFLMDKRPILAGIMLGCAIGTRITSGAMLLPLALLIYFGEIYQDKMRALMQFTASSLIVGAAWFLPVYLKYKLSILTYSATGYNPSFGRMQHMLTDFVWGYTGLWGIALAIILTIMTVRKRKKLGQSKSPVGISSKGLLWFTYSGIALYIVAFFMLPHQRYLLPIVPLILLLVFWQANRVTALVLTGIMLVAPFVNLYPSQFAEKGILNKEHERRQESQAYIQELICLSESLDSNDVIVVGWWFPKIEVTLANKKTRSSFAYLLDSTEITEFVADSAEILYVPGISDYNLRVKGVSLSEHGTLIR